MKNPVTLDEYQAAADHLAADTSLTLPGRAVALELLADQLGRCAWYASHRAAARDLERSIRDRCEEMRAEAGVEPMAGLDALDELADKGRLSPR